jgi:hypothetical protein
MRLHLLGGVVFMGLLAVTAISKAQDKADKAKKDNKVDYAKVAAGGPGVSNVVRDAKGRILSVLVVGRSRISTVLGAAKGKEIAQQRASLQADAEFVKWLGSKVEVHENAQNETTLFLEGSEENDKEALRESGKSVEKTSEQYKRTAQGFVRGMQIVYKDTSGKKKEMTIVKKWRSKTAEAIENIGKKKPTDDKPADKKPATDRPAGKRADKVIRDEKVRIKE